MKTPAKCISEGSENRNFLKTPTSQQSCDSVAVPSQTLIQNGGRIVDYVIVPVDTLNCLFGDERCQEFLRYTTALRRRQNTVCSALLSNGPQQTLRRYRVRPYLERRFWTRPGRTSAWWDNFLHEVVIPEEWL